MRPIAVTAAVAVLWLRVASAPAQPATAEPPPSGSWQDAPGYAALFAPSGPRADAYRFYVSRLDVNTVLEQLAAEPSVFRPPGAWVPAAVIASDAFGQTGRYDRSKLARLYGARRALVAHGPRGPSTTLGAALPSEAWTLVSPYPSRDMERLEPGTLLIVVNLAGF